MNRIAMMLKALVGGVTKAVEGGGGLEAVAKLIDDGLRN